MLRWLIVLLLLSIVFQLFLAYLFVPVNQFPDNGVWYCEEYQIQISFESGTHSYVTIDGEPIRCTTGNDRGSRWLYLCCDERRNEHYMRGESVFGGELVYLDEETLVLEDERGIEYRFVRSK